MARASGSRSRSAVLLYLSGVQTFGALTDLKQYLLTFPQGFVTLHVNR